MRRIALFNKSQHKKKAIAYYRHSAEDKQENSVPIQRERTREFALKNNVDIIQEEADEGKTGLLGPESRSGFRRLLENWVNNKDAPHYDFVFVLDESRWGRFQNLNEPAHYEFLFNKKGKEVVYVNTGFIKEENKLQGQLTRDINRYMAAQYSKELSNKVFYGCVKVSEQGYSAGGMACYGMARLMLDADKKPMKILNKGEHKAISNARVIFVPANDKTTDTVKEIFKLCDKDDLNPKQTSEYLNSKGICSANGGKWNREKITRVLTNPIYIGTRVYNKTWGRLRQKTRKNPIKEWVVVPNAFDGLIDKEVFQRIQEKLYWRNPALYKQGMRAIKKANELIKEELKRLFLINGIEEDDAISYLKNFPIIYSSKHESQSSWCFNVPNEMRQYQIILGVSIAKNKKEKIDRIFIIPTNELGRKDFSIFSEKDIEYSKYLVSAEKVEEKVFNIAKELGISLTKMQVNE